MVAVTALPILRDAQRTVTATETITHDALADLADKTMATPEVIDLLSLMERGSGAIHMSDRDGQQQRVELQLHRGSGASQNAAWLEFRVGHQQSYRWIAELPKPEDENPNDADSEESSP